MSFVFRLKGDYRAVFREGVWYLIGAGEPWDAPPVVEYLGETDEKDDKKAVEEMVRKWNL